MSLYFWVTDVYRFINYSLSISNISERALGYGLPSETINGDDAFEVYSVCKSHIDKMRKDPHPVFIEAKVHRQLGHWIGDPQNYRSEEEVENLPACDPLRIFLDKIRSRSDISSSDLEKIESKVSGEIKEAATFANNSSYLPLEEATRDYLKE